MLEAYRKNSESLADQEPPAEHELNEDNTEEIMAGNDKETVLTVESIRKTNPALFTELKEAVLQEIQTSESHKKQDEDNKRVLKENQDMKVELARLQEAQAIQAAGKIVIKALEKSTLPEITKTRLIETVPKLATMKDGKLDEAAFTTAVTEAVKTETDYVAKLTESGKVKGMGGSASTGDTGDNSKLKESWINTFKAQGKSQKDAEIMAESAMKARR
jgi:DNA primase catalytic subunit